MAAFLTRNLNFKLFKGTKKVRNLASKFKSSNANEWLRRRENDLYIEKAKKNNYRCRSAFKLIEINEKYQIIKPGYNVVDIGAAPGSWSQVLATETNSNGANAHEAKGTVIAIDLSPMQPIPGVILLQQMDFTQQTSQEKIIELLKPKPLDVIVSDMAPPATGVKDLDQENIIKLAYQVVVFGVRNLKVGGHCLIKIFEGQHHNLVQEMKKLFKNFKLVKPNASYSSSSENYVLGRGFLGLKS